MSLNFALRSGCAAAALVLVAGCGGGGTNSTPAPPAAPVPTTPTPPPAATPPPTTSPAPTAIATPAATFDTAEFRRSDGPGYHNAPAAWQLGANGQGVTIAVVDTGIDVDSPEFAGRISPASADVAGSRGVNAEDDHGTNVAMIAAAARDNIGIMGIAWQSTIMALRADTPGSCATADPNDSKTGCRFADSAISAGVDRAVQNGAKVINLSLGGSSPGSQLRNAVSRAAAAGVVVVVSAGNDADSTDASIDPANPDPFAVGLRTAGNGNVIIAGSVNENGQISAFSNRAGREASWYLTALGERVCCVYDNGTLKVTTDSSGQRFVNVISGTSFSAPQIAGAAALLRQAFPNLTATQVVDLLLRTARDAGASGTDATYGRGILDIANAFAPHGATTLAGSTVAVPLGTGEGGVTSPAMGDAVLQGPLAAIALDEYQRAYKVDLGGTLRPAQVNPRLEGALSREARHVSAGNEQLALAFSIDGRGKLAAQPWVGQLRLASEDSEQASVLAARLVAQVSSSTRLGFAYAQGSDGLTAQLQGRDRPAFLVTGSPLDDVGFSRLGQSAIAVRRALGPWGLTLSAESGSARAAAPLRPERDPLLLRAPSGVTRFGAELDRSFGRFELALGTSWLREQRTILGARLSEAFGAGGADSLFVDLDAAWRPAAGWRMGAGWRQGWTHARTGGLVAGGSQLTSSGWSFDVARQGVFGPGDSLAFRMAQPLRVRGGGLNLDLPVAYSYDTLSATRAIERLSLAPRGREIASELTWRGPLWNGSASASVYYRQDPGHYADLPDDKGVALGWSIRF